MDRTNLSGVLADSVASVDDGDRGELGRSLRASGSGVAKDDRVSVATEGAHRVGEALALRHRRGRGSDRDDRSTQTVHSRLERTRRASRRLVEDGAQHASLQDLDGDVALDEHAHLGCDAEKSVEILAAESADGEDVAVGERRAGDELRQVGDGVEEALRCGSRALRRQSHQARLRGDLDAIKPGGSTRELRRPGEGEGGGVGRRGRGVVDGVERLAGEAKRLEGGTSRLGHGEPCLLARLGRHDGLGDVASTAGSAGEEGAVEEDGVAAEDDAVDCTSEDLVLDGRPVVPLGNDDLAVDLDLDVRVGLERKVEDGAGVVGEACGEVVEGKASVVDRREEETGRFVGSRARRVRVAELESEAVGKGADGEGVDDVQVGPERRLVLRRREALGAGVSLAREKERVDRDVASDLQVLALAHRDQPDVGLTLDVRDVHAATVEAGEEEDGGEVGGFGVGDDGLVDGPRRKVGGDGGDLVCGAGERVEGEEEGLGGGDELGAEATGVVESGGDGEGVVAVRKSNGVLVSDLERQGVLDARRQARRLNLDRRESSRERRFRDLGDIDGAGDSDAGNVGASVDEAREDDGAVRGLVVDARNLEGRLAGQSLDEELRALENGEKLVSADFNGEY